MEVKRHWIGKKWYLPGAAGNDINKVSRVYCFLVPLHSPTSDELQTNVPDKRLAFRHNTLMEELNLIYSSKDATVAPKSALINQLDTNADAVAAHAMAAK